MLEYEYQIEFEYEFQFLRTLAPSCCLPSDKESIGKKIDLESGLPEVKHVKWFRKVTLALNLVRVLK